MMQNYTITAQVLLFTIGYNLGTFLEVEAGPLPVHSVQAERPCDPKLYYDPVVAGCVRCVDTLANCIRDLRHCPEPCIGLAIDYHRSTTAGPLAHLSSTLGSPSTGPVIFGGIGVAVVSAVTIILVVSAVTIIIVVIRKRSNPQSCSCNDKGRERHNSRADSIEPLDPSYDRTCHPEDLPESSSLLGQDNNTPVSDDTVKDSPDISASCPPTSPEETRSVSSVGYLDQNGGPAFHDRAVPFNEAVPSCSPQGTDASSPAPETISPNSRSLSLSALDNLPEEADQTDRDSTDSGNGEDESDDALVEGSKGPLSSCDTRSTKPLSCDCSSRGFQNISSYHNRPLETQDGEGWTPPGDLVSDWTSEGLTHPKESSVPREQSDAYLGSLRLREEDDGLPPSPDERQQQFILTKPSDHHGQCCAEANDILDLPPGLPTPGATDPNLILSQVSWVEEYVFNGKEWEINISVGCSLEKAAETLAKITGLSPDILKVNIYNNCLSSFERHGRRKHSPASSRSDKNSQGCTSCDPRVVPIHGRPGSRKRKSESDNSLEILTKQANPGLDSGNSTASGSDRSPSENLPAHKFELRIGEKMFWYMQPNQPFQVTIGSFVNVTDVFGATCTCAQTSCEGAGVGTRCFVYRAGKLVEFGMAKFVFEEKNKDGVSYDVMLVKINLQLFEPVPMINVEGLSISHTLKLRDHIENATGTGVKKLISNQINSRADGRIRYSVIGNKKGHYYGLIGVTHPSKLERISEKGDCGTLITTLPQGGALYAIGAIYGADTRLEGQVKVGYSVIFPIKKAFDRLIERYNLRAIDMMGDTASNSTSEELNMSIQESAAGHNEAAYTNHYDLVAMDTNNPIMVNKDFQVDNCLDSGFHTTNMNDSP